MIKIIIFTIIGIACIGGLVTGIGQIAERNQKLAKTVSVIGGVVIVTAVVVLSSIDMVETGNVGLQKSYLTGLKPELLDEGIHLRPLSKVINFPVSYETLSMRQRSEENGGDESFSVNSKTGQPVRMEVELEYRYIRDRLVESYRDLGGANPQDIEDVTLKGKIREIVNTISVNYPASELYSHGVDELKNEASIVMSEMFDRLYGIEVINFAIFSQNPNEDAQKIIADKENATGQLEVARIRTETIKEESTQKEIEAESKAKIEKIEAEDTAREDLNQGLTAKQMFEKYGVL